jgi:hypothetical protein
LDLGTVQPEQPEVQPKLQPQEPAQQESTPPAQPQNDYQEKFRQSSREAQNLIAKNNQAQARIEQLTNINITENDYALSILIGIHLTTSRSGHSVKQPLQIRRPTSR